MDDSRWTHRVCWADFRVLRPEVGEPARVKVDEPAPCCFCGQMTSDGIYIRCAPDTPMLQCARGQVKTDD